MRLSAQKRCFRTWRTGRTAGRGDVLSQRRRHPGGQAGRRAYRRAVQGIRRVRRVYRARNRSASAGRAASEIGLDGGDIGMQVYTPQTGYCADTPIVLALGNFDGVHVGTRPCSAARPRLRGRRAFPPARSSLSATRKTSWRTPASRRISQPTPKRRGRSTCLESTA